MHQQFELWLNRCVVPDDTPEMRMFIKFLSTLDGLTAFRTEWSIYSSVERLAGTIDFVAQDSEGRLVLFDWKRTKQIPTKYLNPFRSMHEPLSHLDDCAGWHDRLQLNVYRYLLMKYYDFDVSAMYVVCTHPDNGETAFVDEVPVLEQEVNVLMNKQRQFVAGDTTACRNDMAHMNDRGSSTVAATHLVPMDIRVPVETSLTQPWVATGEV